jgi:hypothetical protein
MFLGEKKGANLQNFFFFEKTRHKKETNQKEEEEKKSAKNAETHRECRQIERWGVKSFDRCLSQSDHKLNHRLLNF